MSQYYNIMIGGEAGQGLLTLGNILCRALVRCGYSILVTKVYMSRIRGGHNTFSIRVGKEDVPGPADKVDLLIALNEETIDIHKNELSENGWIVCDASLEKEGEGIVGVPFSDLSKKKFHNIAALGVVSALLGLDTGTVTGTMKDTFGEKHPEMNDQNEEAFKSGISWAGDQDVANGFFEAASAGRQMAIDGNSAIAVGAVSAGVKFCSFYPMTPATSIVLGLIQAHKKAGVEVLQAEDEIAAINMAAGASFAGAPAMCATSGGGFALMTEGVSLLGMTETPLVIAVAQRPGPATGLPTRTGQSDLMFVLHGGHGEFPRAIFAPSSIGDCFHLTRKAFELADLYQGPVFILTNQYLADSIRSAPSFGKSDFEPVCPKIASGDEVEIPYKRFAFTASGVSPRLVPGRTEHLVVVDSDEHTEDGHITEDLAVRVKMVDKRRRKEAGYRENFVPPSYTGGESPDLLLVTWGSAFGAALEASRRLNEKGTKASVLNFTQVWPLVSDTFLDRLKSAGNVVCVEENASAQFSRLLRQETGFEADRNILRYDGLPITAGYIIDNLENVEA